MLTMATHAALCGGIEAGKNHAAGLSRRRKKRCRQRKPAKGESMEEVLDKVQRFRAFEAFWMAYGTGTDEEKAAAATVFEGIQLTGYLAGALVEAAL